MPPSNLPPAVYTPASEEDVAISQPAELSTRPPVREKRGRFADRENFYPYLDDARRCLDDLAVKVAAGNDK